MLLSIKVISFNFAEMEGWVAAENYKLQAQIDGDTRKTAYCFEDGGDDHDTV